MAQRPPEIAANIRRHQVEQLTDAQMAIAFVNEVSSLLCSRLGFVLERSLGLGRRTIRRLQESTVIWDEVAEKWLGLLSSIRVNWRPPKDDPSSIKYQIAEMLSFGGGGDAAEDHIVHRY